ncbi:MAG: ATP-binding cassette domain-containing protein [Methanomicrobiales archaeon]|nr:ATP-binding cassette domain-containing protein [Methanomicrobiales archaeon]
MLNATLIKKLRDFELDIDLSVNDGEVMVLLGENGSGKSTVLNLLSGLLVPDEGNIILNNIELFSSEKGIFVPPEERNIGYVFQNYALFPHMTVFDNISFGLRMRRIPKNQFNEEVDRFLEDLGIAHVKCERVTNLSGGQRQRVALARALIIRPHLLLLDEPLTALDQSAREKIRLELRTQLVNSNQPSILVTHSLKDARIIGDKVMMLEKGKVIWSGKASDLKSLSTIPDDSAVNFVSEEYISFSGIAID